MVPDDETPQENEDDVYQPNPYDDNEDELTTDSGDDVDPDVEGTPV